MEKIGIVKWFNNKKGIGFIKSDSEEEDIFIHYSNILGEGYKTLQKNDKVKFLLENEGKGFIAKKIKKNN